jgi:D-ribulokinase
MIEVVLGIDVGTSGVRIAARDKLGELKTMAAAPIHAPLGGFGRALQDPHLWWDAVKQAYQSLDLKGLQVLALAIDGTSGTILPVDANGTPVGMASMYNDVAETEAVNRVEQASPVETAARGATSPLARALAVQNNAARILHQADWLLGRFCGRFDVSDENNALKTGYDPVMRQWPEWIARTGLDVKKLPTVLPAGERIGIILPDVAAAFRLPDDVIVVAGTTDGCATFLASGAKQAGDGATSLGTTLTLKLLSATPVFAPQYGIYSHRISDQWLAGGASNSGGAVLKKFFSADDVVRLTDMIDPAVATGLDYYPLPETGERFPMNDAQFQSRTEPRPKEDHVFLQGLFEGMAAIEALGYLRLAELGATALASIRSAGGGAANEKWTAIRLKKLGVPSAPAESEHAAMGVARLAWRGIGHDA